MPRGALLNKMESKFAAPSAAVNFIKMSTFRLKNIAFLQLCIIF